MRLMAALCLTFPLLLGFAPATPQQLHSRAPVTAQPGDELWSDQFGLPAIDGFVTCAVYFGGELVIGGRFSQAGGVPARNIARWDGAQWLPLGDGLDDDVLALSVFQNHLIAGGRFATAGTVQAIGVAQWDGAEWHSMADGLKVPLQVPPAETWAFVEYGTGLVAAGAFQLSGQQAVHGIAVWDGTQWNALGEGVDGIGRAVAVWRDTLYVGGYFQTASGVTAGSIAKWDGSSWSSVGSGLTSSDTTAWVYSLAVYHDELVVCGDYDLAANVAVHNIASWNGEDWQALGTGLDYGTLGLAVHNGKLVASARIFGSYGSSLAEWDGISWVPGAPIPIGTAGCLLPTEDGLIVGGAFQASVSTLGPIRGFQIAKWTGTDWVGFEPWTDRMHGLSSLFGGYPFIQSLASFQGEVIAGGFLDLAGDPPQWAHVGPLTAWNGSRWRPFGAWDDAFGQTYAILAGADTLYAGGTLYGYSHGVSGMGLWRYAGGSWSLADTLNATIVSLVLYHGDLYVGARRSGTPAPFSGGVYRWNGQDLIAIGWADPGIRAMTVHDDKLIVAGEFSSLSGVNVDGLATWDGHQWGRLDENPPYLDPGEIDALVSWDGKLIAGGSFCQLPGCPAVVSLSEAMWQPVGVLRGHALCTVVANGRLFAGGWFFTPPTSEVTMVAAWDGTTWVGLGSGTNGTVFALQEHDGALYAGGAFSLAGAKSSFGIGRWDGLGPSAPPQVPRATELDAVRPNPFRTSTRIPFTLAKPGPVLIVVYDTRGRRIAVLEDAVKPAGEYFMEWNGRDNAGRPVSSGLYFIHASMPGSITLTRKVALVR